MVLGSEILSIEKKTHRRTRVQGSKKHRIPDPQHWAAQYAICVYQDLNFDGPFPHHNLDTDTVIWVHLISGSLCGFSAPLLNSYSNERLEKNWNCWLVFDVQYIVVEN